MKPTSVIKTCEDNFDLTYIHYDCAAYDTLFQRKCNETMDYLQSNGVSFSGVDVNLFCSPAKHYRHRCRFAIENCTATNTLRYMVWEHGSASVEVEQYPLASELICRCMPLLLQQLKRSPALANHLKAANFLSTLTQELLITLIYDQPLATTWNDAAHRLQVELRQLLNISSLSIIGRSKKIKRVINNEFVMEAFKLADGRELRYKQMSDGFSNPNAEVNVKSLNWICSIVRNIIAAGPYLNAVTEERDILELYCGNGNHTVALAGIPYDCSVLVNQAVAYAYRVVAVEINKSLCSAAVDNLASNAIHNAKIIACDSEKFTRKILREKKYVDSETNTEYSFHTVLVDPPRAGLDRSSLALVAQYRNIIYISCNPIALQRDLAQLLKSHNLVSFAVFDQFAYTLHIECGVHLKIKS